MPLLACPAVPNLVRPAVFTAGQASSGHPFQYTFLTQCYNRTTVEPLRRRIRRRISKTLTVASTCGTGRPVSAMMLSTGVASPPIADRTFCSCSFNSSSAGWCISWPSSRGGGLDQRAKLFENVVNSFDQLRAVANQPVAAPRGAVVDVAGGRRRLRGPAPSRAGAVISAPLRSAASTTTTPSDMPLINRLRCGNMPESGWPSGGDSLTNAPWAATSSASRDVFRRIDVRHARGQHADRPATGGQRPAMRGGVDAACQSADDSQPCPGKRAGPTARQSAVRTAFHAACRRCRLPAHRPVSARRARTARPAGREFPSAIAG